MRHVMEIKKDIEEQGAALRNLQAGIEGLKVKRDEEDKIQYGSRTSTEAAKSAEMNKAKIMVEIKALAQKAQLTETHLRCLERERRDAESSEEELAWDCLTVEMLNSDKARLIKEAKAANARRASLHSQSTQLSERIEHLEESVKELNNAKSCLTQEQARQVSVKATAIASGDMSRPELAAISSLAKMEAEVAALERKLRDTPALIHELENKKLELVEAEDESRKEFEAIKLSLIKVDKLIALKKYDTAMVTLLDTLAEVKACDELLKSDTFVQLCEGVECHKIKYRSANRSIVVHGSIKPNILTDEIKNRLLRNFDKACSL